MTKVAVYGTLKRTRGNNVYLKNSKYIGEGNTVKKYAMYRSGLPYVVENNAVSKIKVEVYDVDDVTLGRLDALEGHPNWYYRKEILVNVNEEDIKAFLYFNDISEKNRKQMKLIEDGNYV